MKLLADAKSHFSIGESILTPKQIAQLAKDAGYDAVALCDNMTVSGVPELTKACKANDMKTIAGVRLNVVESAERVKKQRAYYPKLYALTDEGFKIILKLVSRGHKEDRFFHKARLIWSDVVEALQDAKGHVAFSSGSFYSVIRDQSAVEMLKEISDLLSANLTFCDVAPADSAVWDRQALLSYQAASELGIRTLVSRPALYDGESGSKTMSVFQLLINNSRRSIDDISDAWVRDYKVLPPARVAALVVEQFKRLRLEDSGLDASFAKSMVDDWSALTDAAEYQWHDLPMSLPKMADDEDAELKRLAIEGIKQRLRKNVFGYKPEDFNPYAQRLGYELGVITKMGFASYFLLTRDIVMWAKENGIVVGAGRGSAGGSLVAYALGITDVDPIRFDLIFERFINPDRLDYPDIDMDFMSTRRQETINRIEQDYGVDYVAGITNYSMLGSKSAINDLSRVMDLKGADRVLSKLIPEEQNKGIPLAEAIEQVPEIASFAERYPEIWQSALDMEDRVRNLGKHAGGVVVSGVPIVERAIIETRSKQPCVNWDKDVVESMGLIKMDILGLSTLDLLFVALKKIKERHGLEVDLSAINLDDHAVLELFGRAETVGIFQFEGGGARKLLKELSMGGEMSFEEITAATALNRPGPMESGLMQDFIDIKIGEKTEHYDHKSMKPALQETRSVIVYQEQVMRIARDLCGFSMAEADTLRKAIGKKKIEVMETMKEQFITGAVDNGMKQTLAESLWDKIEKFAGYGFNKSHAVAYTLISYQSAWLKTHFPTEFYAAALTILDDDKKMALIKDASRRGIKVLPPDVNTSTDEFEILDDKTLVAPFSIMKGISEKSAGAIVTARGNVPFDSLKDFEGRVSGRSCNATVRKNLMAVGAFVCCEGGPDVFDPVRRPDQLEFTPTIMLDGGIFDRPLMKDKVTKEMLAHTMDDFIEKHPEYCDNAVFVAPKFGRHAKVMVVTDGPTWKDEREGSFGPNDDYVKEALGQSDLVNADIYWTGVSKTPKPKGEKLFSPEHLRVFGGLLHREIEILNPQVILCLGTNAMRSLVPSIKGTAQDNALSVRYIKADEGLKNDRNIIIGISPGMVYFDESKQDVLNELFAKVSEMTL